MYLVGRWGSSSICPCMSRQDNSCEPRALFGRESHSCQLWPIQTLKQLGAGSLGKTSTSPSTQVFQVPSVYYRSLPISHLHLSSPPSQIQHGAWEHCREIAQEGATSSFHPHTALPWTQFPRPEYLTSGQPPHLTAPPLHLFSIPSSLPSPGHRPSSASYYFSSPTLKSFFPDLSSST